MRNDDIISVEMPAAGWMKPELPQGFPYISSRLDLERLVSQAVPWHWQSALELFYVDEGCARLATVRGSYDLEAGSAVLVNADVLHMCRPAREGEKTVVSVHVFDPMLIAGIPGGAIDQKFLSPVVDHPGLETVLLRPSDPGREAILERLRESFILSPEDFGYELKLREKLSLLWLDLVDLVERELRDDVPLNRDNKAERDSRQLKMILTFIHRHYGEKISVDQLAAAGGISKRACFRLFQERMGLSPIDYVIGYRIQAACAMLVDTRMSVTEIASVCGLGSSSYFVKTFRRIAGITPLQYRKKCRLAKK